MKKILSILLFITLLVGMVSSTTFAETEIKGLDENLDELLMRNYFTEEEIAEIDNKYKAYRSEYLLNEYIPLRQSVNKMETDSVEEEYALLMGRGNLDYDSALRVSNLTNFVYGDQYAKESCFDYLFDGKEYWNIVREENGLAHDFSKFTIEGEMITDIEEYLGKVQIPIKQQKAYELIREKIIKNLLKQRGESEVEEIKFFALGSSKTGLYIKCPEQEYVLMVYDYLWDSYKRADKNYYEFMTVCEMAQYQEEHRHSKNKTYVTPVKFTFDKEAETLQAEGLLLGTEKGLELLKPLTRAEAATILLRAMGESTDAENTGIQTFSDVASDYWGYGAVENSYKLGIMNGIGDNLFAPEENVTAAQFSTMVLRASGSHDFDWETALNLLIENGIISQEDSSTMDFFTRCDMAKIIYEAKAKGLF